MTEGLFLGHNHLCIYPFVVVEQGQRRFRQVLMRWPFLFALPNIFYPYAKRFRQPTGNQNRWRALHVLDHRDVVYADTRSP